MVFVLLGGFGVRTLSRLQSGVNNCLNAIDDTLGFLDGLEVTLGPLTVHLVLLFLPFVVDFGLSPLCPWSHNSFHLHLCECCVLIQNV